MVQSAFVVASERVIRFAAVLLALTSGLLAADNAASAPSGPLRDEIILSAWQFQPGTLSAVAPDVAKWKKVGIPYLWHRDVPGCDSGWLEAAVTPSAAWQGARIYFDALGLECDGILFVNGKEAAQLHGPDARVDITAQLSPGQPATLRLWITRWWVGLAWSRKDDLIRDHVVTRRGIDTKNGGEDAFRQRIPVGVSGRLRLCAVPAAAEISDVTIQTSVRKKEMQVEFAVKLAQPNAGTKLRLQVSELSNGREGLPATEIALPALVAGKTEAVAVTLPWTDPKLWAPGAPNLYLLHAQIAGADGKVIDAIKPVRFGFREFWTEKNQLLLNGQPFRMRLTYSAVNKASMEFFSGIGFNGVHLMPVPGRFFGDWGYFPGPSREELSGNGVWDIADEMGWAMYVYAPGVHYINQLLVENPQARVEYQRYMEQWLRRYGLKNHPSVLAWSISMNNMGTADPRDFGRRRANMPGWYVSCEKLVKQSDPTRLVFHHQGGPNGDFQMQNLYLNFMALQEREEFPSLWSATGDMPVGCAEMGTPFTASFFRYGNTAQFTEYAAIYFGDGAYARENDEYVRASLKISAACPSAGLDDVHGDHYKNMDAAGYVTKEELLPVIGQGSGYFDFMHLFNRNTNRAYRAFGMNAGWWPWMMDIGFGVPPGFHWNKKPGWAAFDYRELKEGALDYRQRPDWANPLYDAFRATMQPALFYWGGRAPNFFTKEHTYAPGASADKTIVAVWDGPGALRCAAKWALRDGAAVVGNGEESFVLAAGAIEKRPVTIPLPQNAQNGALTLTLTVVGEDGITFSADTAALHLLPLPAVDPALTQTVEMGAIRRGVCDPHGQVAAYLRERKIPFREIKPGDALEGMDELIVGNRALDRLPALPFTPADVARGLRVLLLSCDLDSLEACGFRAQEAVARRAYIRVPDHPALQGLQNVHLTDWHGAGTQIGKTSDRLRQWGWMHAPHWNNNGSIASVVIETPHKGAYTPLVDCEFDLSYTPLLEWRHGKGLVLFSQFDLFDRAGSTEPAAEKLKAAVLTALGSANDTAQDKTLVYGGTDAATRSLLVDLGFALRAPVAGVPANPAGEIMVVGADELDANPGRLQELRDFVRAGGTVLTLPQKPEALQQAALPEIPLNTRARSVARLAPEIANDPLLRGIGPQLLHWRTFLELPLFMPQSSGRAKTKLEGLLLDVAQEKGRWVFCQLDWRNLAERDTNVRRTHWRMRQFYRQLCTNLGAQTAPEIAQKQYAGIKRFAQQVPLRDWLVCKEIFRIDPSQDTEGRGSLPALAQTLASESEFVQIPLPAGVGEKWERRTVQDGMIDFGRSNVGQGRVGLAATWVYSSRTREAEMTIRGDWWLFVKVNGQPCLDNGRHSPAGGNANQIILPLKDGWNRIEVKLSSGGGGFNFQASLSDPGDLRVSADTACPALPEKPGAAESLLPERHNFADVVYCTPLHKIDDPYGWHPW